MLSNKQAFTLIELVVVVLIIAILAALAVAQYQRAVARARLTEELLAINTAKKQMELHILEHGYVPMGNNNSIEVPSGLISEYGCGPGGCSVASYHQDAAGNLLYVLDVFGHVQDEGGYPLSWGYTQNGPWYQGCWTNDTNIGKYICKSLEEQGWKMIDDAW